MKNNITKKEIFNNRMQEHKDKLVLDYIKKLDETLQENPLAHFEFLKTLDIDTLYELNEKIKKFNEL